MDILQLGKKEYGFKKLLKKSVARASALFEIEQNVTIKSQNVCNFL